MDHSYVAREYENATLLPLAFQSSTRSSELELQAPTSEMKMSRGRGEVVAVGGEEGEERHHEVEESHGLG